MSSNFDQNNIFNEIEFSLFSNSIDFKQNNNDDFYKESQFLEQHQITLNILTNLYSLMHSNCQLPNSIELNSNLSKDNLSEISPKILATSLLTDNNLFSFKNLDFLNNNLTQNIISLVNYNQKFSTIMPFSSNLFHEIQFKNNSNLLIDTLNKIFLILNLQTREQQQQLLLQIENFNQLKQMLQTTNHNNKNFLIKPTFLKNKTNLNKIRKQETLTTDFINATTKNLCNKVEIASFSCIQQEFMQQSEKQEFCVNLIKQQQGWNNRHFVSSSEYINLFNQLKEYQINKQTSQNKEAIKWIAEPTEIENILINDKEESNNFNKINNSILEKIPISIGKVSSNYNVIFLNI